MHDKVCTTVDFLIDYTERSTIERSILLDRLS